MSKKIIIWCCFLFLSLSISWGQNNITEEQKLPLANKTIPEAIHKEAAKALSYYPELDDVEIEFKFKDRFKKSFMQAQPKLGNLFKGKNNRSYYIFISRKTKIEGKRFSIEEIPSDVLIGWLGHELGHVMDYREKSAFGLIIFGFRYLLSENYLKHAERAADTHAVNKGMVEYIVKTKEFILNNSKLSDHYKNRIQNLYLSPEEIMVLVNEVDEEITEEIEDIEEEVDEENDDLQPH